MIISLRASSIGGLIRRSRLWVATFVILVTTVVTPLGAPTASADTSSDISGLNKAYYGSIFLRDCLVQLRQSADGAGKRITQTRVDEGTFLSPIVGGATKKVAIGRTLKTDDGIAICNDTNLVKSSLSAIGFSNGGDFLKAIGYTATVENTVIGEDCSNAKNNNGYCEPVTGDITIYVISGDDSFNSTIMSKHPQADYARYVAYLNIFNSFCKLVEPPTGSGDSVTYKKVVKQDDGSYKAVDTAAEFAVQTTTTDSGNLGTEKVTTTVKYGSIGISNFDYQGQNTDCRSLLSRLDGLTTAVAFYNNNHKGDPIATTIEYKGPADSTSSVDCTVNPTDASCATGESSCTIEGIGWIVCPVMNFMSSINDTLYSFLATYFLEIKPAIFSSTGNENGLYQAWNTFRGIANILFIVAFLIILYSQITSVGITNYGVKKLLPKLIVAAILVNVSYYVCQVAVDISNILGWGLKSLFDAIGGGVGDGKGIISTFGTNPWGTIVGGALATAGTVALLLAISVPVLLAGLLSLLMVVVILITRQALVILLVAISPIAFVAWLLPNTEKWFKKWWEVFFAMLMLFPIISVLYGAGALAANILGKSDFGDDGGVAKIAALGASILPLALTIPAVNGALKATGALGAKLSGWSNSANKRVGSTIKTDSRLGRGWNAAWDYRKKQRNIRQDRSLADNTLTRGAFGAIGGGQYSQRLQDNAVSAQRAEYEEGVKAAAERQAGNMTHAQILTAAGSGEHDGRRLTDHERDAAIRYSMDKGSMPERGTVLSAVHHMTREQRRSTVNGARAKGDGDVYGQQVLGNLELGQDATGTAFADTATDADVQGVLDTATTERLRAGSISVPVMTRDAHTARYITARATADPAARTRAHADINQYRVENAQDWAAVSGEIRDPTMLGGI